MRQDAFSSGVIIRCVEIRSFSPVIVSLSVEIASSGLEIGVLPGEIESFNIEIESSGLEIGSSPDAITAYSIEIESLPGEIKSFSLEIGIFFCFSLYIFGL